MMIRKALLGLALFASMGLMAAPQTFTGIVTDSMCGKKHTMMPGKPDSECVRACVKAGSKYALLVGDKVYTLSGDPKSIDPLAGKKAKVTGELKGDTITVTSIAGSK